MYHNSGLLSNHQKPFTMGILSNLVLLNEGKAVCVFTLFLLFIKRQDLVVFRKKSEVYKCLSKGKSYSIAISFWNLACSAYNLVLLDSHVHNTYYNSG